MPGPDSALFARSSGSAPAMHNHGAQEDAMSVSTLALLSLIFLLACFVWTRLSVDRPHRGPGPAGGRVPESPVESARGSGTVIPLEKHRPARRPVSGGTAVEERGAGNGGRSS